MPKTSISGLRPFLLVGQGAFFMLAISALTIFVFGRLSPEPGSGFVLVFIFPFVILLAVALAALTGLISGWGSAAARILGVSLPVIAFLLYVIIPSYTMRQDWQSSIAAEKAKSQADASANAEKKP